VSAPGTLTVTIERNVGGRWVAAGTQTLTVKQAGNVPLTLGASFGGHQLAPGTYRLTVRASANGQSSAAVQLPLTVAPPANGPHGQPRLLSVAVKPHSIVWREGVPAPRLWLTFLLSRNATMQMSLEARVEGRWQQVSSTTAYALAGADRLQLLAGLSGFRGD